MNGIINVYKEAGFTSFDVVAKMRGICHQKKIGHTGTLDPDAVGVLPVCLGNATRACELLTDRDKTYEAILRLGVTTDTQDMSGQVLTQSEVCCTEDEVRKAILSFVGEYDQIPPMYSAKKVDGKKLYELAREGKVIERKSSRVRILDIVIKEMDLPIVRMEVSCSKGTYIRTLCHDIGEKLGCGGAMEHLARTKVGRFTIDKALTLDILQTFADEGRIEEALLPVDEAFEVYPAKTVNEKSDSYLYNGNVLEEHNFRAENTAVCADWAVKQYPRDLTVYRIYDSKNRFCGLFQYRAAQKSYKAVKMFLPENL